MTADYFGAVPSMLFLAFAYLGGISSVSGAVVGGMLVAGGISTMILTSWLHVSDQYTLLIAGTGLILMAIFNPQGVAGGIRELSHSLQARRHAKRGEQPEVELQEVSS